MGGTQNLMCDDTFTAHWVFISVSQPMSQKLLKHSFVKYLHPSFFLRIKKAHAKNDIGQSMMLGYLK